MPPKSSKRKTSPKKPKKSSKRKTSPGKPNKSSKRKSSSSSSDDEIRQILQGSIGRAQGDWSVLLDRPQSTIIRWPSPQVPIKPNKWAGELLGDRKESLARGKGDLFGCPGVCSKCAGFPRPGDVLFNQLALEVYQKRPSTSGSSSSSSSSSSLNKDLDYECTGFDGTKISLRKKELNPSYFRHIPFGTKRKKSSSSSNKSPDKKNKKNSPIRIANERDTRRIGYCINDLKKTGNCKGNPWEIASAIEGRKAHSPREIRRMWQVKQKNEMKTFINSLKNMKLNRFSSKQKKTSKVYTGERGGKYIIKNGTKRYLKK